MCHVHIIDIIVSFVPRYLGSKVYPIQAKSKCPSVQMCPMCPNVQMCPMCPNVQVQLEFYNVPLFTYKVPFCVHLLCNKECVIRLSKV